VINYITTIKNDYVMDFRIDHGTHIGLATNGLFLYETSRQLSEKECEARDLTGLQLRYNGEAAVFTRLLRFAISVLVDIRVISGFVPVGA